MYLKDFTGGFVPGPWNELRIALDRGVARGTTESPGREHREWPMSGSVTRALVQLLVQALQEKAVRAFQYEQACVVFQAGQLVLAQAPGHRC